MIKSYFDLHNNGIYSIFFSTNVLFYKTLTYNFILFIRLCACLSAGLLCHNSLKKINLELHACLENTCH